MILGQSWFRIIYNMCTMTAEEELRDKISKNKTYPFEYMGNGFQYVRVRPASFYLGLGFLSAAIVIFIASAAVLGYFKITMCLSIVTLLIGLWFLSGKFCARQLVLSRNCGYMVRLESEDMFLLEQEIHNLYIRLNVVFDSSMAGHYYVVLNGRGIEPIRLSRMSHNEIGMRALARKIAENLNLNYFDYHTEAIQHIVRHPHPPEPPNLPEVNKGNIKEKAREYVLQRIQSEFVKSKQKYQPKPKPVVVRKHSRATPPPSSAAPASSPSKAIVTSAIPKQKTPEPIQTIYQRPPPTPTSPPATSDAKPATAATTGVKSVPSAERVIIRVRPPPRRPGGPTPRPPPIKKADLIKAVQPGKFLQLPDPVLSLVQIQQPQKTPSPPPPPKPISSKLRGKERFKAVVRREIELARIRPPPPLPPPPKEPSKTATKRKRPN